MRVIKQLLTGASMKKTKHIKDRMRQRRIDDVKIEVTMLYGEHQQAGDRIYLSPKSADKALTELRNKLRTKLMSIKRQIKALEAIIRQGGITVVVEGDTLITVYFSKGKRS